MSLQEQASPPSTALSVAGDVSPGMLEIGMWVLAGYLDRHDLSQQKQEHMLRNVYRFMRLHEDCERNVGRAVTFDNPAPTRTEQGQA